MNKKYFTKYDAKHSYKLSSTNLRQINAKPYYQHNITFYNKKEFHAKVGEFLNTLSIASQKCYELIDEKFKNKQQAKQNKRQLESIITILIEKYTPSHINISMFIDLYGYNKNLSIMENALYLTQKIYENNNYNTMQVKNKLFIDKFLLHNEIHKIPKEFKNDYENLINQTTFKYKFVSNIKKLIQNIIMHNYYKPLFQTIKDLGFNINKNDIKNHPLYTSYIIDPTVINEIIESLIF